MRKFRATDRFVPRSVVAAERGADNPLFFPILSSHLLLPYNKKNNMYIVLRFGEFGDATNATLISLSHTGVSDALS